MGCALVIGGENRNVIEKRVPMVPRRQNSHQGHLIKAILPYLVGFCRAFCDRFGICFGVLAIVLKYFLGDRLIVVVCSALTLGVVLALLCDRLWRSR